MDKVGLSSPWVTFVREMSALFDRDPEILVQYFEEENEIKLYVDNSAKADALSKLLPEEKSFGNIVLKITVVPSNEESTATLFRNAFAGNPVVDSIEVVPFTENAPINYVIFSREVVSFFNDDMSDYFGAESTLFENIARDVFEEKANGVCFCTNVHEDSDLQVY